MASLWLPCVTDEGVKLPHRYASFLRPLGRGKKMVKRIKPEARSILIRDLGLSPRNADVFLSRDVMTIERIEEEIKALVDNLLLFNLEVFRLSRENLRFLLRLLRKVVNVSTYNVDSVTKQYKQFCNVVWMTKTKSEVIETPEIGRYNIFRFLLSHPLIEGIDLEKMDKRELTSLAHLTSTRNFVAGGRKVMEDALDKFHETTSREFNPHEGKTEEEILHLKYKLCCGNYGRAGRSVGRKVKEWLNHFPDSSAHISLNSAGSFLTSSKDGGRFVEINEDLRLILNIVPEVDAEIILPMGFKAQDKAGLARWKTWARNEPITAEAEFGSKIQKLEDFFEEIRFWGLDEVLGYQIFLVALLSAHLSGYIDMEGKVLSPIPARTLCVPEPGGKSRVVTTSLWWVTILQQPGGHLLKELLKLHPSAESGMERTDQAWNYIPLIRRVTDPKDEYALLSSDLSEATDAIVPKVILSIAEGFLEGIGHKGNPLLRLGLSLVTSERLIFMASKMFVKKRGILMGEPMTKGLLCLYNLAVEENAIREYLFYDVSLRGCDHLGRESPKPEALVECYSKPVQVTWRAFHVGGDDHLAYGPLDYLRKITETHICWGSKISKDKHAISGLAVKYCEKVLALKGRDLKLSEWDINSSSEKYERSVWVDSIKVRLLSPISKSIEVQNDRNIAIGKAISLGRTLRWLNPDYFPHKWVVAVRERFFKRMKAYLPKEGTSLYYQILLPQKLGGLDLYLNGEIADFFWKLPQPTIQYIQRLLKGQSNEVEKWQMSTFVTTDIERGIDTKESLMSAIQRDAKWVLISRGFGIESLPIKEARDKLQLPAGNMKQTLKSLKRLGWETFDSVLKMRQRPRVFQEMLLRGSEGDVLKYGTMPWKKRYAFIWDLVLKKDFVLDEVFLKEALKGLERIDVYLPLKVYNVREETDGPLVHSNGKITVEDASFEEECTRMLPNLSLKGILNHYHIECDSGLFH